MRTAEVSSTVFPRRRAARLPRRWPARASINGPTSIWRSSRVAALLERAVHRRGSTHGCRARSSKITICPQNFTCNEIDSHLPLVHCLTHGAPPDRQANQPGWRYRGTRRRPTLAGTTVFRMPRQRPSTPTFVGTAPSRGAFGSSQSSEDRESNQTAFPIAASGDKPGHLFIPRAVQARRATKDAGASA